MMTTKERNDRLQMIKKNGYTRFFLDIRDDVKRDDARRIKDMLEDVEAKQLLILDALIYYTNSEEFRLERYEGPGHVRNR